MKAMFNKVSTINVNWNSEQFLKPSLTAFMNQTVMPYEIVLVNNL